MQLYANVYKAKPEIVVSHNGEEVAFLANVFTRKSFSQDYDVFDQINRYWAALSNSEQEAIFRIYKEIYQGFDQILNSDDLYQLLNVKIRELFRLHPLVKLEFWIAVDPYTTIPSTFCTEFVFDRDSGNTREKTYTRKDYIHLVAMAMFMRTLVPIWGEYINSVRSDTGIDCKEYIAMQLLVDTGLLECEAMKKLTSYTDAVTREKHKNYEKILSGISSEDMCFLLVSLVCVRRVCVADIRGNDPDSHIISAIWKFLYQKVFNTIDSDSTVRKKEFKEEDGNSDQNKRSQAESYRKRTELSIGEIAVLEYAFENVYDVVERLAPDLSRDVIDRCIETARPLQTERIGDPQLDIMSWVFKRQLSPQAALYIRKRKEGFIDKDGLEKTPLLWTMVAATEAVLSHWGLDYLAILSTSYPIIGQEEMIIAPIDSRNQIPEELMKQIHDHFP